MYEDHSRLEALLRDIENALLTETNPSKIRTLLSQRSAVERKIDLAEKNTEQIREEQAGEADMFSSKQTKIRDSLFNDPFFRELEEKTRQNIVSVAVELDMSNQEATKLANDTIQARHETIDNIILNNMSDEAIEKEVASSGLSEEEILKASENALKLSIICGSDETSDALYFAMQDKAQLDRILSKCDLESAWFEKEDFEGKTPDEIRDIIANGSKDISDRLKITLMKNNSEDMLYEYNYRLAHEIAFMQVDKELEGVEFDTEGAKQEFIENSLYEKMKPTEYYSSISESKGETSNFLYSEFIQRNKRLNAPAEEAYKANNIYSNVNENYTNEQNYQYTAVTESSYAPIDSNENLEPNENIGFEQVYLIDDNISPNSFIIEDDIPLINPSEEIQPEREIINKLETLPNETELKVSSINKLELDEAVAGLTISQSKLVIKEKTTEDDISKEEQEITLNKDRNLNRENLYNSIEPFASKDWDYSDNKAVITVSPEEYDTIVKALKDRGININQESSKYPIGSSSSVIFVMGEENIKNLEMYQDLFNKIKLEIEAEKLQELGQNLASKGVSNNGASYSSKGGERIDAEIGIAASN